MLMTSLCLVRIFFFSTFVECCSLSSFSIPLVRTCHTTELVLYKYIYLKIYRISTHAVCVGHVPTSSAELNNLAPLWYQVVAIGLSDSGLDGDTVLRPWAEEPMSPHCHGEGDGLGNQLGRNILEVEAGRICHRRLEARLLPAALVFINISKQM